MKQYSKLFLILALVLALCVCMLACEAKDDPNPPASEATDGGTVESNSDSAGTPSTPSNPADTVDFGDMTEGTVTTDGTTDQIPDNTQGEEDSQTETETTSGGVSVGGSVVPDEGLQFGEIIRPSN